MGPHVEERTCIVFEGKENLIEVKEVLASGFSRDVSRGQVGNAPTAGTVISEHECPILWPLSLTLRPLAAAHVLRVHLTVMAMHVQMDASRGRQAPKSWSAAESPCFPRCHGGARPPPPPSLTEQKTGWRRFFNKWTN